MQVQITHEKFDQQSTPAIVGVFENNHLAPTTEHIDNISNGYIRKILSQGDISGKIGESLLLYNIPGIAASRVLLTGCGTYDQLNGQDFQKIISHAANALKKTGTTAVTSYLLELPVNEFDICWKIRQSIIAAADSRYTFDQCKSEAEKGHSLDTFNLAVDNNASSPVGEQASVQGQAIANGIKLTKDLANLPANICTPSYLAAQAKALHRQFSTIKIKVLDESDMKKLGMEALLSVSKGSKEPAKLVILEYFQDKAGNKAKPHVLVGKGITFDSGGISLKPGQAMDEMKYDMCGAASVLGTMQAIAEMQLPINLVGIIACSENLPSGEASKPGDIVTSMSGKTIEILNTDAEGRLVLCDALSYAKKYEPETVIDIATLTGAVVIALGHYTTGIMSNHKPLTNAIIKAGQNSLDPLWELPMGDNYKDDLHSNFADIANISGGRAAGSITAACFLSHFTEDFHWAHLDIAGTAWKSGKEKGATGRPVPALVQYLIDCSKGCS